MKLMTAVTLLLLGTSQAFAAGASCADKYEVFDNTVVQSIAGNRNCFVTVHPRNIDDMTYRDFLFDDVGIFMVFNSFGEGPESETAGAREFYFFPRKNPLSYKYDAATKRVAITAPSGKVFTFNTEKSVLLSISNTTITQDFKIDKNNKGGIEITQNDGIYLDLGFAMGQSPSQNPKRSVVFKDAKNSSCSIRNSDIFNYTIDKDTIFKFSDSQLSRFLSRTCPQLKK